MEIRVQPQAKKGKRIRIIGIITATNKNKKHCHEQELLFPFVSTYKTCLRRNRNKQEFFINIYDPFLRPCGSKRQSRAHVHSR